MQGRLTAKSKTEYSTMINQDQIDFFAEHGYLRYGRVLEMDAVDELRASLDSHHQCGVGGR